MGDPTPSRPPPAATGTLAKTPLLHLLVYALEKKLGGTIELATPDRRQAAVLFVDGKPAKVRTSEAVAYLGRVLLELGSITEAELTQSLSELAKAKAGGPKLHGELLVARGFMDRGKVDAGLREQIARKLRHVAALPAESQYAYYDGYDGLRGWGGEGRGVDPVPLFWGMLLEYPPWERVSAALASVSASPLRLSGGADLDRLGLGKEERAAAELLRAHPVRVSELPKAGHLNDRTAQLLTYLLLITRQVDVLSAAKMPPTPSMRPASSAGLSSPPVSRPPVSSPIASVPPVSRPPMPSSPALGGASSPPPISPSVAPKRSQSPKPHGRSTTPPPQPVLPPELGERWREIVDRAATIDRADYFMMLDLARDATHSDVEAAFFALAKRWHPDRLPPELAPVRDSCSRVFARMSEAHATLTDDTKRANYMRLLADGSGSPETQATLAKVVDAATAFQKAEVCFRRNDYAQAEAFCRKALEDDPTQPDYHALLAWLVSQKPENHSKDRTLSSIQMLDRAISMSDRCEKAYFWRGQLYKRIERNDLAVRDFRRAAELNPRNIDAVREVRLYHMRGGRRSSNPPATFRRSTPLPPKPEESGKPGILGRLFKKP
jgi:curved DNA-binding protein CbpA